MNRNYSPAAAAWLQGDGAYSDLRGRVTFAPCCGGTLVTADIRGLPPSESDFFAFHIHEGESCQGAGFPRTGSHYNPWEQPHPRHAGDLPPLLSCGGRAYLSVLTDRFQVADILGKTVVVHSHPDDFRSQPSGDAGSKIACGIIRRV